MTGGSETEGFPPEPARPSLRQRDGQEQRFRKRPVTIEARHWDGAVNAATTIIDWMLANGGTARYHDGPSALSIDTLEGTMTAVPGDWIIRGVAGEFYPCREDIFEQTYEPADGETVTVSREDLRWAMGLKTLTAGTADTMRAAQARIIAAAGDPR